MKVLYAAVAALGLAAVATPAMAQCCGEVVAPTVAYYAPAPVTTYYAPSVSYYAPAPVTTYYAPSVSYYAPAPVTTYYAPAVTTAYYAAPVAGYYFVPRRAWRRW